MSKSWQSSPNPASQNKGHHNQYNQQILTEQQIQTEQLAIQQKNKYKVWSSADFLIISDDSGQKSFQSDVSFKHIIPGNINS